MMISEPAWWCLEATWQRLLRRQHVDMEAASAPDQVRQAAPGYLAPDAEALAMAAVTETPPLDSTQASQREEMPSGPLTAAERRARAAALRALALSRGRRFEAARDAFADAARLDPALDLTRTPTFWTLERAAHEAAIDAYLTVGRERDAAVLRARVRSTFRPKAVRRRQEPVFSP